MCSDECASRASRKITRDHIDQFGRTVALRGIEGRHFGGLIVSPGLTEIWGGKTSDWCRQIRGEKDYLIAVSAVPDGVGQIVREGREPCIQGSYLFDVVVRNDPPRCFGQSQNLVSKRSMILR